MEAAARRHLFRFLSPKLLKEPSALYLLAATQAGHFRNPVGGGWEAGPSPPLRHPRRCLLSFHLSPRTSKPRSGNGSKLSRNFMEREKPPLQCCRPIRMRCLETTQTKKKRVTIFPPFLLLLLPRSCKCIPVMKRQRLQCHTLGGWREEGREDLKDEEAEKASD